MLLGAAQRRKLINIIHTECELAVISKRNTILLLYDDFGLRKRRGKVTVVGRSTAMGPHISSRRRERVTDWLQSWNMLTVAFTK